jgi:hypothetical protein
MAHVENNINGITATTYGNKGLHYYFNYEFFNMSHITFEPAHCCANFCKELLEFLLSIRDNTFNASHAECCRTQRTFPALWVP